MLVTNFKQFKCLVFYISVSAWDMYTLPLRRYISFNYLCRQIVCYGYERGTFSDVQYKPRKAKFLAVF